MSNKKISKELFEAVYKYEKSNVYVVKFEAKKESFEVLFNVGGWEYFNYNDFFFECKEWASSKDYELFSGKDWIDGLDKYFVLVQEKYNGKPDYVKFCEADSEQQAVFDACQWILEKS